MKEILNAEPLEKLLSQLQDILPMVLGIILFFIVSWIMLRLVLFIVKKSLKLTKIDSLIAKVTENGNLLGTSVKFSPTQVILGFVKWFMILILVILGSDLLGLTMISQEVGKLVSYLPRIFSAFVILGLGLYFATIARRSVQGMIKSLDFNGSKIIGLILFYIIVAITIITSLNQAGVNTDIITKNLSIILGAMLATFTIAMGLGTKDIITRLVLGFYARKNFAVGQWIRVDQFEGKIEAIDNICLKVSNGEQRRIYPIKMISNKRIEILQDINSEKKSE